MQLTQEQCAAVRIITGSPGREAALAGPAGSGKTTLLKSIQEVYVGPIDYDDDSGDLPDDISEVEVCTPTNKAAQVLRTKGVSANTLYKVFFMPEMVENLNSSGKVISRWLKFTPCNEYSGHLPSGKRRHASVIIVDEASMLQTWVVAKLRKMCDKLILIGDPHQLPPVKDKLIPGGYFNTLEHDAVLKTIHRQAEGSDILGLATAIRGESPKVQSYINSFRPEMEFEEAVANGYQFIAFTNKERSRINTIVRKLLGRASVLPEPGDKMISTDNFNDVILNGTCFTCRAFEWEDTSKRWARLTLELEDGTVQAPLIDMEYFFRDQLVSQTKGFAPFGDRLTTDPGMLSVTYSYCMTAHKAQGSEWDKVAVIDQRNVIKLMTDAAIARGENTLPGDETARRWLYTAVTRARKELIIAGQWWAVLSLEAMAA
jgi:exodeoxyribonuclease V